MKSLIIWITAIWSLSAQAQYVDNNGLTDYGLRTDVILNGNAVPQDRPVLRGTTARLLNVLINKSDLNAEGTGLSASFKGALQGGRCTGTVIAPNVILTAGHCISSGQWEKAMFVFINDKEYLPVAYVHHPKYFYAQKKDGTIDRLENDIALIFLGHAISGAKTALLPKAGSRLVKGTELIVAGFGRSSATVEADNVLRTVTVTSTESRSGSLTVLGTKTTCVGDSGGPAYVQVGNRYVVVGITSRGNCKDNANFVRVSDYVPWIQAEIEKFNSQQDI